jgi:hypothetical protein
MKRAAMKPSNGLNKISNFFDFSKKNRTFAVQNQSE